MKILLLLLFAITTFYVWFKSTDKKIFAYSFFILGVIFLMRFACNNIDCINNTFLIGSNCQKYCEQCDSLVIADDRKLSTVQIKQIEHDCIECSKCTPDWNVRTAFDTSGLALMGAMIFLVFLYKRNIKIKQLYHALDSFNFFGITMKISELDKNSNSLFNELATEQEEGSIENSVTQKISSILATTKSKYDGLIMLVDTLENDFKKLERYLNKEENVISLEKKKQFKTLKSEMNELFSITRIDRSNNHVNSLILIIKRLMYVVYAFFDYTNILPINKKNKYLTDNIGVDIIGDKYSIIIGKNSKVPYEDSGVYDTVDDNQQEVNSTILVGDSDIASENIEIGKIRLTGIPKKPKGEAKHTISFKVDSNGVLIVKQICHETGQVVQDEFDVSDYLTGYM